MYPQGIQLRAGRRVSSRLLYLEDFGVNVGKLHVAPLG
jgi:hypothetical protein